MSKLKLQSIDREIFEVDIQVVNHLTMIKDMLENMKGVDDNNDDPILLPNCHSKPLAKVLEYCTFHRDDDLIEEDEKISQKKTDDLCNWDIEFLKVDQSMLLEIILVANYLDVKRLMDICCKHVANQIKNKSADEIRSMFNIKNDFTMDELSQLEKENEWCEDK